MSSRDRWKHAEREIARRIGGRRVPVSGRARGDAPDVEHERLSVEVKSRRRLPDWLHDSMRQAESASKPGQVPVAILHQTGERYADSLCLIRLSDLTELLAE